MLDGLAAKLELMLAGERVVLDDAGLDILEQDYEVRSLPNPRRCGLLEAWLCWIEKTPTSLP